MHSIALSYLRGDLRRNRVVVLVLLAILTLSALLVAGGAMILERAAGAVDRLFSEAKPPHFLQMHQGPYDALALEAFADEHPEIDSWLIEDMVGFDGAAVSWSTADGRHGDLSDRLIDNLFVAQNSNFDFLLDQSGGIPQPEPGEMYIPVAYATELGLRPGDSITVATDSAPMTFEIVGAVRDAQMASSMASSTRFLVAESDLDALSESGGGVPEIIVEYRLVDGSSTADLQQAYEANSSLPQNGQAVTEVMIRLVNVMSDGLIAIALVFAGLMLVCISLLTVRFIIRGSIEDEVREIGALKAIGVPDAHIARLFLGRYSAITLVACVLGGLLAIPLVGLLTQSLNVNFGTPTATWLTVAVPVIALVVLFAVVVAICARMLRVIRASTVVDTLVHGTTSAISRGSRPLHRSGRSALGFSTGRALLNKLTLLDLSAQRSQWSLLPVVYFLTATLITIPFALLGTFQNPQFVAHLGVAPADIRADVQFGDGEQSLLTSRQQVVNALEADSRIEEVHVFGVTRFVFEGDAGPETVRAEVGDYQDSQLSFVDGAAPETGEVALSTLNASRLSAAVGDVIALAHQGQTLDYRVSGIYQDVTSGGYTAKIAGISPEDADRWVVYANVVAGVDPVDVAADYQGAIPATTFVPVQQYMAQTLGYVTSALQSAAIAMLVIAVVSICLIVAAFLQLRLLKDRRTMGTKLVLGFSRATQMQQFHLKVFAGSLLGVVHGIVCALTAGQALVGAAMASTGIGVSELAFMPDPALTYAVLPVLLVATASIVAAVLVRKFFSSNPIDWIRA